MKNAFSFLLSCIFVLSLTTWAGAQYDEGVESDAPEMMEEDAGMAEEMVEAEDVIDETYIDEDMTDEEAPAEADMEDSEESDDSEVYEEDESGDMEDDMDSGSMATDEVY